MESVAVYEPKEFTTISENYKAHYVSAKNGYIGIYEENKRQYVLLQYDGYQLKEVFREDFLSTPNDVRACMVDGYMYILGTHGLKAVAIA